MQKLSKTEAMQAREAREHAAYQRAITVYERSKRPLPVRLCLGLADVVREWLRGQK